MGQRVLRHVNDSVEGKNGRFYIPIDWILMLGYLQVEVKQGSTRLQGGTGLSRALLFHEATVKATMNHTEASIKATVVSLEKRCS